MILSFSIENWMSFRDRAEFSMVASLERQHGERLPSLMKYRTRLLPVAAVYGGNASGKTNLCKALNFVRSLVVHGTQPEGLIPVEPFRLDSNSAGRPSRFSLEILVEGSIYEFSLAVDEESVLEESLTKILASS